MRLSIVVSVIICSSLYPASVRADDVAARAAADHADALQKAGKFEEACAYREVAAKESSDFRAKWESGMCYEGLGKTATAWLAYDRALQFALAQSSLHADDTLLKEQVKRAKIKVAQIAPTVPKLRLAVADKAPGLTIFRGEEAIGESLWATDIPLDPGDYSLAANAPGYQQFSIKVTLKVGEVTTVTIPSLTCEQPLRNGSCPPCGEFEAWSAATKKCECTEGYARTGGQCVSTCTSSQTYNVNAKACVANAASAGATTTPSSTPTTASSAHGIPVLTWVLGGAGVASLATAGMSILVGNGQWQDAQKNHCVAGNHCDSTGISEEKTAMTLAGLSAVTFVAGLVLVAGGVTVFAIGNKSESAPKASVLVTPGGLRVVGSF
jgi:hypothetical protein